MGLLRSGPRWSCYPKIERIRVLARRANSRNADRAMCPTSLDCAVLAIRPIRFRRRTDHLGKREAARWRQQQFVRDSPRSAVDCWGTPLESPASRARGCNLRLRGKRRSGFGTVPEVLTRSEGSLAQVRTDNAQRDPSSCPGASSRTSVIGQAVLHLEFGLQRSTRYNETELFY